MKLQNSTLIHVTFLVLAVLFAIYYSRFNIHSYWNYKSDEKTVYGQDQLALYNGDHNEKIFVAFLGVVYDVTTSRNYYGKGAPYHYFAGKDGSKAFVTGNFDDNSDEKDHVLSLSCTDLLALLHWRKIFREKYKAVGVLNGRFYNENGHKTSHFKEFSRRIKDCEEENNKIKHEDQKYPPCNVEWSQENGSRVWCTNSSGGIKRDWTGVPRQLFIPDKGIKRCVCINLHNEYQSALLKEYRDCPPTSPSCEIHED